MLKNLSLSLQFGELKDAARHRAALPRHKVARWIRHALDTDAEITVRIVDAQEGQALNRDYRYQLTPIGGPGPDLYIAQEVQNNRFQIAGGSAGLRVSWQVTGIRQDDYANAHRIPVEEDKPADERGLYLHPTELGKPADLGLDYQRNDGLLK